MARIVGQALGRAIGCVVGTRQPVVGGRIRHLQREIDNLNKQIDAFNQMDGTLLMTEPVTHIPVEQLRQVFELLIAHISEQRGNIPVSKDYFWSIPDRERYDVHHRPDNLTVGQVSESWENLRGLLEDESKALGYGLVWLADVLRAIGDDAIG